MHAKQLEMFDRNVVKYVEFLFNIASCDIANRLPFVVRRMSTPANLSCDRQSGTSRSIIVECKASSRLIFLLSST